MKTVHYNQDIIQSHKGQQKNQICKTRMTFPRFWAKQPVPRHSQKSAFVLYLDRRIVYSVDTASTPTLFED